jgi:GT2 family glycosyltransferase
MMQKIIIGYPCQDFVVSKFCRSLVGLMLHRSENYSVLGVADERGIYIDENRNNLVRSFLKTEADWLLQLDSDLSFQPNILDILLSNMSMGSLVISGWYFLWRKKDNGYRKEPSVFNFNGSKFVNVERIPAGFCEMQGSGAGCLLVHRSVYEKIGEDWFSEIKPFKEDLSFCLRLMELGLLILIDSRVQMIHHKMVKI